MNGPTCYPTPSKTCGCPEYCQCDCKPVACCDLECPERPNFFCGQLLDDADLNALLAWTQTRLQFKRYREGWGVVCGLEVCRHPDDPCKIIIQPGYAVDCCGRDVVLCKPLEVSFRDYCTATGDACACWEPDTGKERPPWLQLELVFKETPTSPRRVLGDCAGSSCQPGRFIESAGFRLLTPGQAVCPDKLYEQWVAHCPTDEPFQLLRVRPELQHDLGAFLGEFPICHFPFLEDEIPADGSLSDTVSQHVFLDGRPVFDGNLLANFLFYLSLDQRLRYVTRCCLPCLEDTGIPLARLYLRPRNVSGCRIFISDRPPWRRTSRRTELPAPPGQVNLAGLLGMSPDEACIALRRDGFGNPHIVPLDPPINSSTRYFKKEFAFDRRLPVYLYTCPTPDGHMVYDVRRKGPDTTDGGNTGGGAPFDVQRAVGSKLFYTRAPRGPEDLLAINGIGVKACKVLHHNKIYNFTNLRAAKGERILGKTENDEINAGNMKHFIRAAADALEQRPGWRQ